MNLEKNSGFEWLNIDDKELEYHLKQYSEPKEYTKSLLDILVKERLISNRAKVLDLGCGCGAVTNYLAKAFPNCKFIGLDLNSNYIEIANKFSIENTRYCQFDLYSNESLKGNMEVINNADALFSFQTLSWLPNYNRYIELLSILNIKWGVVTSLFYDGYVDAEIKIKDYTRSMGSNIDFRESYYNIYSINLFDKALNEKGFYVDRYIPFDMPYDLPKPTNKGMSTYTLNLQDNSRLQVSGPLLMSWYTIIIKRK